MTFLTLALAARIGASQGGARARPPLPAPPPAQPSVGPLPPDPKGMREAERAEAGMKN